MNMRNYMKKKEKSVSALSLTTDELIARVNERRRKLPKAVLVPVVLLCALIPIACTVFSTNRISVIDIDEDGQVALVTAPMAATTAKKDLISIPSGTVKANPFLPYRDIGGTSVTNVGDVPTFDLVEPPEVIGESTEGARVMDTVVSGILFDKFSPSAILNIEGNDYLVKKGDVVNNYKVVSIMKDSVTVKLGSNTFKAGIGEILTEGSVNHNDVSNLSKKFGGERR